MKKFGLADNITRYETLEQYLTLNNLTIDDWNDWNNQGFIYDITCGLFNGAADNFTPWDITDKNLIDTIKNEINADPESYQWENDDFQFEQLSLDDVLAAFDFFYIADTKHVYLNRD